MSETPTLTSEAVKIPEDTSLTYDILAFNLLKKLGPKGLSLEKDVGLYRTLRDTGENIILKNVADKVNHNCDFAQDYFSLQIRKRMIDSLEDNAPDNAKAELERMEIAFKFKYVPIIIEQADQQATANLKDALGEAASDPARRDKLKEYLDKIIKRSEDQIIKKNDLKDDVDIFAVLMKEPTIGALFRLESSIDTLDFSKPQIQKLLKNALININDLYKEKRANVRTVKVTVADLVIDLFDINEDRLSKNYSYDRYKEEIYYSLENVVRDANRNYIVPTMLDINPSDLEQLSSYNPFLIALENITYLIPRDIDGRNTVELAFEEAAQKLYEEIKAKLGKKPNILGPLIDLPNGLYFKHISRDKIVKDFRSRYKVTAKSIDVTARTSYDIIKSYELQRKLPKTLKDVLEEFDMLFSRHDPFATNRRHQLNDAINYIHRDIFDEALGFDIHTVLDGEVSILYQLLSSRIRANLIYSNSLKPSDMKELEDLYLEFIKEIKKIPGINIKDFPKDAKSLIKRYRKKFSQFDAIINADGYYIPRPKKNKIPEREPRILPFPARHDPMAEKLLSTKIVQAKAEVPIDINQRVDLNNIIRLPEHLNTYEDKLNFYRTAQNVLAIIAILPYDLPINGSANHLKLDLQKLVKQIFQKLGQNQYGVNYNSPSQVFNDFDLVLSQWWKHNGSNLNIKHILDDDQVALYTEMIESGFNPTELQRKPGEEKLTENQILRYLNNRVVAFEYNGFTLTLPPGILARNIVNLPSYTDQIRVLHMFALPQASVDKSTTAANTWVPVNTSPVPPSDSEVNENTILVNPSPSPVAVPVALASSEHRSGSALLTAAAPLLLLQTIDSNRPMTEPREENQAVYEHAAVNLFFLHLAAQTGAIRWGDLTDLETKLLDNLHVDQNVHDMPYEKLFSMFTASPIGIGNFQPRLQFGLKHKLSKQAKIYLPDDKVKLNDPNYLIKLLKVALPNGLQVMIPGVDNTVAIMTDVLIDNFKNLKTYQKLIILGQIFNSLENQSSIYQI